MEDAEDCLDPIFIPNDLTEEFECFAKELEASNKRLTGCSQNSSGSSVSLNSGSRRKEYASINSNAMGVDTSEGPKTELGTFFFNQKLGCQDSSLPEGWERHEDEIGEYFWHIKTGTIQRHFPTAGGHTNSDEQNNLVREFRNSLIFDDSFEIDLLLQDVQKDRETSCKSPEADASHQEEVMAIYIGKSLMSRADLNQNVISFKINAIIEKVMEDWDKNANESLDSCVIKCTQDCFKLIDFLSKSQLRSFPYHSIKSWGVSKSYEDVFAFVARERDHKHYCHLIRCENMQAAQLAINLNDYCTKYLSKRQDLLSHGLILSSKRDFKEVEPCKRLKAKYLGSLSVRKSNGIQTIHQAIDQLLADSNDMVRVTVSICPSTIKVEFTEDQQASFECRIRFLSFLGLGPDIRYCGFIVQASQNEFRVHTFQCLPSAVQLCDTIKAACDLRYVKCLEARPPNSSVSSSSKPNLSYKEYLGDLGNKVKGWLSLRN